MKRVIRFLARLYPAAWRRRYGAEFDALIEDDPASWRSLVNVLLGVFKMQLTNWNFVRIVAATAALGVIAALVASFAVPKSYRSTATVMITGSGDDRVRYDSLMMVQQQALSRASLTPIILSLSLYPSQAPSDLQQTIETMRQRIRVIAVKAQAFAIEFEHAEPLKAQNTVQQLTARMLSDAAEITANDGATISLAVLDPPSAPLKPVSPNRVAFAGWGLAMGTALGALFGLLIFHFARIVMATAVLGTLAGFAGSFAIPKVYRSRALFRIFEPEDVAKIAQAIGTASLAQIIEEEKLGRTIESVRASLRLHPVRGAFRVPTFVIEFDDRDPVMAQRTVGAVLQSVNRAAPQTLRIIDPAIFPTDAISPNRSVIAAWGLAVGIAAGIALGLFRRKAGQAVSPA